MRAPSSSASVVAPAYGPSSMTMTPWRVVRYGLEKSTACLRSSVIDVWYAATSNGFTAGLMICSNVTVSHTTSSAA